MHSVQKKFIMCTIISVFTRDPNQASCPFGFRLDSLATRSQLWQFGLEEEGDTGRLLQEHSRGVAAGRWPGMGTGLGVRPSGLLRVPPSQSPGPAAAVPLGLGLRGGGGLRRGPRPPGSTNFSASSSSILLLFFSLKERENKRRVSIKLHRGRRKGMGDEGTGRGLGDPRGAAVAAHCRALSRPSPARRSGKTPILTAPRHPPYCSPPLPRSPRGVWARPGGAGLQVNGKSGGRSQRGREELQVRKWGGGAGAGLQAKGRSWHLGTGALWRKKAEQVRMGGISALRWG